jgi:L-2-hydroxyglutarate oxidase LhgO
VGEETEVEVAVIGAGVVGLAVARALALAGREVAVLESERQIGLHTSSRNSEVIHGGMYYAPGSLKARLCVAGRRALYAYAAAKGVPHRKLGKLIVATQEDEVPALRSYLEKAAANGVEGLSFLSAAEVRELEPEVRAVAGLFSAETGIVDSHQLMRALLQDARGHGASIAFDSPIVSGSAGSGRVELRIGGHAPATLRCAKVVNSAGLWAQAVARSIEGVRAASIPPCHYAIGHYFTLSGAPPFSRLVYPIAIQGGLGIHLTLDLAGRGRFGPDVEWIDRVDYRFDETRAPAFEAAIRRYWPGLPDGALRPGYTGIRPKLGAAGSAAQDFVIQDASEHGVSGLINLYGIESPGLTAALAIADHVARLLP